MRSYLQRSSAGHGQRGQSVVELALVMSVFALLALGVVDLGRMYGMGTQLTNAADQGAKVAAEYYSSYSSNLPGLNQLVKNEIVQEGQLDPSKITNLQISLQTPATPDYTGERIVKVSFQYQFTFLGPWSLLPGVSNPYTMPAISSAEPTR